MTNGGDTSKNAMSNSFKFFDKQVPNGAVSMQSNKFDFGADAAKKMPSKIRQSGQQNMMNSTLAYQMNSNGSISLATNQNALASQVSQYQNAL